jgi:hypothetical protein
VLKDGIMFVNRDELSKKRLAKNIQARYNSGIKMIPQQGGFYE